MKTTTIGGLDAALWIGRNIRLRAINSQRNACLATLIDVGRKTATVQPFNAPHPERVKINRVLPWWSANPDLKALVTGPAGGV